MSKGRICLTEVSMNCMRSKEPSVEAARSKRMVYVSSTGKRPRYGEDIVPEHAVKPGTAGDGVMISRRGARVCQEKPVKAMGKTPDTWGEAAVRYRICQ
jgi:hypothetical protein